MLRRTLDELPGARFIDTENASSNAAMVAINDALGFREHHIAHCYEIEIDRLRRLVG
jgi:hypothetical protein